jgi:hypothetical protein
MSKTEETTVNEWLTVIHMACDPDSPFTGMIDLTEIFNLPLEIQKKIHAALTPVQLECMKKLYGPKEGQ